MIVDAQIEIRPILLAIDEQGGRLLAALVAARRFARLHRRDQAAGKRQGGVRLICRRRFVEHLRTCEHVAGNRKSVALDVPFPVDAGRADMRGDIAFGVHDMKLAMLAAGIGGNHGRHDLDPPANPRAAAAGH